MIKLFISLLKKIILAIVLLYTLNIMFSSLNIMIPINYLTISIVCLLGMPGIVTLFILLAVI